MSGSSSWLGASTEYNTVGPDYFGFYTQELVELLSQDDDLSPFLPQRPACIGKTPGVELNNSSSKNGHLATDSNIIGRSDNLFSGAIGVHLSDFKREKLTSLVRESLFTFAQEVDEMLHPILSVNRMRSLLEDKKNTLILHSKAHLSEHDHYPEKKQKVSTSQYTQDLGDKPVDAAFSGEETLDICSQNCEQGNRSPATLSFALPASKVDEDLQFLIGKDSRVVEKYVKKSSDELLDTIGYMEQKLEEFIDIVMSRCRSMTLFEKQKLQRSIQDLPARNLDRVVEIIQRNKSVDRYACDEIYVDLENENKVTLWRLYYYVEAVENARKLCEA